MKRILDQVGREKAVLPRGKLFRWLSDEAIPGDLRLSFAPAMLYYLMGFKDVLEQLARSKPESSLERVINAYCGEDAEHWRWYLTDLEELGYGLMTWGETIPTWCDNVWSSATRYNRQAIFDLVQFARASTDPLQALSLIMVFEATGVVFIGHTRKAAIAMGKDDRLKYFGRLHYEEEFGHSAQARDFDHYVMDEGVYRRSKAMVHDLFRVYECLFDCWFDHVSLNGNSFSAAQRTLS